MLMCLLCNRQRKRETEKDKILRYTKKNKNVGVGLTWDVNMLRPILSKCSILYTIYIIEVVTFNSPNPSLKGSKCSLWLCYLGLSLRLPSSPLFYFSFILSFSPPFFPCFGITLHNNTAFTFTQRSWGLTGAGFRHNCQSTYPPTYADCRAWLCQGNTHFPTFYVFSCECLWCLIVCAYCIVKISSTYKQWRPAYMDHHVLTVCETWGIRGQACTATV